MNACGCKGIRTCLMCEKSKESCTEYDNKVIDLTSSVIKSEVTCSGMPEGVTLWRYTLPYLFDISEEINKVEEKINLLANKLAFQVNNTFDGLYVFEKLIEDKKSQLLQIIDQNEWRISQSGRKKQDFGPKINYKKMKVKQVDNFNQSEFFNFINSDLIPILKMCDLMADYVVAGIGNLFYVPGQGAHIDPHIDDYWIWGKRIVGINLLSETKMTFSLKSKNEYTYELNIPFKDGDIYVLTEHARYIWKHAIKKENILSDRIAVTIREYETNYAMKNEV